MPFKAKMWDPFWKLQAACVRRMKQGPCDPSPSFGAGLSDSCQPQSALVLKVWRQLLQNTHHIKQQHRLPLSRAVPTFQGFYECNDIFSPHCPTAGHWELPSIMTVITGGDHWRDSVAQLEDKYFHWLLHKIMWTIYINDCINSHADIN